MCSSDLVGLTSHDALWRAKRMLRAEKAAVEEQLRVARDERGVRRSELPGPVRRGREPKHLIRLAGAAARRPRALAARLARAYSDRAALAYAHTASRHMDAAPPARAAKQLRRVPAL